VRCLLTSSGYYEFPNLLTIGVIDVPLWD